MAVVLTINVLIRGLSCCIDKCVCCTPIMLFQQADDKHGDVCGSSVAYRMLCNA